jgi:hypothetical protein
MPDAKSGRVHILRNLAVPGVVAAEDAGNHFLLSLTRRSECCRSGSQISGAGLYERQRANGRCRSVEGGWLFNGLKKKELHEHSQPLPCQVAFHHVRSINKSTQSAHVLGEQ